MHIESGKVCSIIYQLRTLFKNLLRTKKIFVYTWESPRMPLLHRTADQLPRTTAAQMARIRDVKPNMAWKESARLWLKYINMRCRLGNLNAMQIASWKVRRSDTATPLPFPGWSLTPPPHHQHQHPLQHHRKPQQVAPHCMWPGNENVQARCCGQEINGSIFGATFGHTGGLVQNGHMTPERC